MKIRKVILYLMAGKSIRRPSWEPTDRLIQKAYATPMKIGNPEKGWIHWMPSPLDLIADDWEVVE